jgi:hypothetical protein
LLKDAYEESIKLIIDKITKLKEDWPALATVNVISDQVKPSKGKDLFK